VLEEVSPAFVLVFGQLNEIFCPKVVVFKFFIKKRGSKGERERKKEKKEGKDTTIDTTLEQ
jgi:hypothetical protein